MAAVMVMMHAHASGQEERSQSKDDEGCALDRFHSLASTRRELLAVRRVTWLALGGVSPRSVILTAAVKAVPVPPVPMNPVNRSAHDRPVNYHRWSADRRRRRNIHRRRTSRTVMMSQRDAETDTARPRLRSREAKASCYYTEED